MNPCFLCLCPARSRKGFVGEDSETVSAHGNAWMSPDVISFVIRSRAFGDIRNLGIFYRVHGVRVVVMVGIIS